MHPDDVFYECNGNGKCSTSNKYVPGQQWGLTAIGAAAAWKYTTGSSAVKVRPCALYFRYVFKSEEPKKTIRVL